MNGVMMWKDEVGWNVRYGTRRHKTVTRLGARIWMLRQLWQETRSL